jgi:transposase
VLDHDSVVLAWLMFTRSAWCISEILARAGPIAARAGFAELMLACQPTGNQSKLLVVIARTAGIPMVCVQPLLVYRAAKGRISPATGPASMTR